MLLIHFRYLWTPFIWLHWLVLVVYLDSLLIFSQDCWILLLTSDVSQLKNCTLEKRNSIFFVSLNPGFEPSCWAGKTSCRKQTRKNNTRLAEAARFDGASQRYWPLAIFLAVYEGIFSARRTVDEYDQKGERDWKMEHRLWFCFLSLERRSHVWPNSDEP